MMTRVKSRGTNIITFPLYDDGKVGFYTTFILLCAFDDNYYYIIYSQRFSSSYTNKHRISQYGKNRDIQSFDKVSSSFLVCFSLLGNCGIEHTDHHDSILLNSFLYVGFWRNPCFVSLLCFCVLAFFGIARPHAFQ